MTHLAATTDTEPLGDPVPAILTAYYEAIDTNRFEDAAATFALRGLYAVPQPDAAETAPRVQTIGPDELLDPPRESRTEAVAPRGSTLRRRRTRRPARRGARR